jgi:hypothetical protein
MRVQFFTLAGSMFFFTEQNLHNYRYETESGSHEAFHFTFYKRTVTLATADYIYYSVIMHYFRTSHQEEQG